MIFEIFKSDIDKKNLTTRITIILTLKIFLLLMNYLQMQLIF